MKKMLVVSAYAKDLSWLDPITDDIVIYEKNGRDLRFPHKENITVHQVKNVGREPHTYLHHIVENYNNLADVTYFTQDDPFDHVANFLDLYQENAMGWFADEHYVCDTTGERIEGMPFHPDLPFDELNDLLGTTTPKHLAFKPGCIFAITREQILQNDQQLYQRLRIFLEEHPDAGPRGPRLGRAPWVLERLWGEIFALSATPTV